MPTRMKANGNFSDANLERLHSLSISCVMSPSVTADLESPLSVGMRVSVLQPFWIAMIIFCWKVKLLKLLSVTLANICGTNSHNRRAKGQPGVGVVKILCDSDSSGSKSFRLRLHSPGNHIAYFIQQTSTIHSVDTDFLNNTKYSFLILYVIGLGWWWTARRQVLHNKVFSQHPQVSANHMK